MGNTDEESVVTNSFYPPIVARKIRLHPMSWKQYSKLRVEYLGCYHGIRFSEFYQYDLRACILYGGELPGKATNKRSVYMESSYSAFAA